MRAALFHVLRGFLMGSADLVPGVSGGTIALVLGIYRRLVASVRTGASALSALVRGDLGGFGRRFKEIEWLFIVPLLIGIGLAVISLSHLIESLLDSQPRRMAGLFFGLVVASIVVAWRLIENSDATRLMAATATAVVTFVVMGLSAGPVADPTWWMFLGGGALAICAMILPGISGSFILLMLGMYDSVLGAVNDRDLLMVGVFLAGAVVGLASFSTLLHRLLEDYHDTMMAVLVGLMAGSLRVLWPWPDGTGGTSLAAPGGDVIGPIALAFVGALFVLAITRREAAMEAEVDAAADVAS